MESEATAPERVAQAEGILDRMPIARTDMQLRAALTRTIPAEDFSAEGLDRYADDGAPIAPASTALVRRAGATTAASFWPEPRVGLAAAPEPHFSAASLAARLAGAEAAPDDRRYDLGGVLGVGATGRVYALVDRNLERAVAVKVLVRQRAGDDELAAFVDEARITASLSHPNVLPVYELDRDDTGQVFFTMKKIDGRSLADAIDASTADKRVAPLDQPASLVNVFIGICQALAYAHHQRVVHQDVKPANIMLGAFGEVLLVDWGSARRMKPGESTRIYGTPLYMSPEQARHEAVDEASDVYCVGATLFHALTLRVPTWDDDAARFFALKREGAFAPPDERERAAVPAALMDIALKAMAPRRSDRYGDAEALLADLHAYQAGLAVGAHRDSLAERLARWYRLHARALWASAAAAVVVLAMGAALWREHERRVASWGEPVLVERFSDDSWRSRWETFEGSFATIDGQLVSTGSDGNSAVLTRKLWGPTVVEYDCELKPGSHPSDLSLMWSRELRRDKQGRIVGMANPIFFQFGALDGSFTAIGRGYHQTMACSERRPEPGRRHRVRVEIVDDRLSLIIDGEPACEWIDPVRFDGGYVGIYAYYPGKAYDDLRMTVRDEAEQVPATAVGDAFVSTGELDQAFEQYARVAQSHAGSAISEEAVYKLGLCRWLQQRWDEAETAWRPLIGGPREPLVRLHRLDRWFTARDHDATLTAMEALWHEADARLRARIAMRWNQCVLALTAEVATQGGQALDRYLALHDRLFPDDTAVATTAAHALRVLGRYDQVLTRYPRQRSVCAEALAATGRWTEILTNYPEQRYHVTQALFHAGRSAEIGSDGLSQPHGRGMIERGEAIAVLNMRLGDEDRLYALCTLGRIDEAIARSGRWWHARALAQILKGDETIAFDAPDRALSALALLAHGDARGAYAVAPDRHPAQAMAGMTLATEAWADGRRDEAARWATIDPRPLDQDDRVHVAARLTLPFLAGADDGDWSAYDAACAALADGERWRLQQRPWHDGAYLVGRIDDQAYLAQPHRLHAAAKLLVRRAMRAERAGDGALALTHWRTYLELPRWRRWLSVDGATDALAAYRVRALSR